MAIGMRRVGAGLFRVCGWCCLAACMAAGSLAAEPSHFRAGQHKGAALELIQGIPVATVSGTPEEMGEQLGTLLKQPLMELVTKKDEVARGFGLPHGPSILLKSSTLLLPKFPDSYRRELMAESEASGVELGFFVFGNLLYDFSRLPACSTLAVEAARSKTGAALLGRNFDFPTFGFLDRYSLVVVYRPQGKHAFAAVTFPLIVGVFSGMNDAGLCVAQLEVNQSADKAPRVDLSGTPIDMCFRQVLEDCTTIDEAEKLLREEKRGLMCNLAVCDKEHAAVLEMTPKTIVRRSAESGICPCTNHFRSAELAVDKHCSRYARLDAAKWQQALDSSDIAKLLNAANQGRLTIQTMIFEPATLEAHLSFGPLPSSAQPLKTVALGPLLRPANRD